MTSARIAAADVEGGDDFIVEADRLRLVEVLDGERNTDRLGAGLDDDGGELLGTLQ